MHINRPVAKGTVAKKPTRPVFSSSSSDPPAEGGSAITKKPTLADFTSTAEEDSARVAEAAQRQRAQRENWKMQQKFQKKYGNFAMGKLYKPSQPTNLKAFRAMGGDKAMKRDFNLYLRAQAQKPSEFVTPPSNDTTHDLVSHEPQMPSEEAYSPPPPMGPSSPSVHSTLVAQPPPPPPPPPMAERLSTPPTIPVAPPVIPAPPSSLPLASSPPPPPPPPVVPRSATISAAPVRYTNPNAQTQAMAEAKIEDTKAKEPREPQPKRQKIAPSKATAAAEKMMAKMGYVAGKGLGKNNDGIIAPLLAKERRPERGMTKPKSYDDYEEKSAPPNKIFDIIAIPRKQELEKPTYGEMSKVIVAVGLLDAVDWAADAERNDGGIRQEIGDFFADKFGTIHQIHIKTGDTAGYASSVYIKFVSELSGLNACQHFGEEGGKFHGRQITASFYPEEHFTAKKYVI